MARQGPEPEASAHLAATIVELAAAMDAGTLTSRALTAAYLERIDAVDRDGPRLRAVLETNPEALDDAADLDRERAESGARGPLHGIPVLLKDNIATVGPMETTAGSSALVGTRPVREAHLVTRLRAAGAVVLGKANLSEWANIRSTRSTSGWSARGGFTRNPYALDRNPSGSSSGSAVAVAADLCVVAVGTETDGSIVSPSSVNGLVGFKPTVGLVSRDGIIPISHSQDTAGPMARTVADAAALLTVLAGADGRDPATREAPAIDFAAHLDPDALDGARLGVVRPSGDEHPTVRAHFDRVLVEVVARGAVIVDGVSLGDIDDVGEPELTVLLYELKHGLREWLAEFTPGGELTSLSDIIEWNRRHADEELRWFGQEHFEQADACGDLGDETYLEARAACVRLAGDGGIDAALSEHRLDALLSPTGGPAWLTDLVNGDSHGRGSFSTPAAVGGHPHVTVPMGMVAGLPVGVSLVARRWHDGPLIGLAHALELATAARRVPTFAPTADLDAPTSRRADVVTS